MLWNLTGGAENDGVHVTDVTNASRTMLMDLATLPWDESIAADMGIPMSMLPEIRSSSEVYGECKPGVLNGTPVAGILGDQQAATFGQACLEKGTAKNTYGTGNFMLLNTGDRAGAAARTACSRRSATRSATQEPVYALEGSIAVTGSLVQWLRDNLGHDLDAAGDRDAGGAASTTTAAPTSCRRSRACSRRTGAPTPAARWSA